MADLKAIKLPNGTTYNLKDAVARPNSPFYGSCSTAAATAEKAVSATGFSLVTGAKVVVKFTVTNTAANPTLNVNSTGAKDIYYRGAAITAGYLAANRTYEFVYNGSQYDLVGDVDTNTLPSVYVGAGYSPVNASVSNPHVSFSATSGYTGFRLIGDGTTTVTSDANHNITISSTGTNTTYTFTNGLSASGTTVSNSGVRSVATGTSNGTISVNTNGTAANVAVKGLGTAAYTAATNYVAKAGDTMTGALYVDVTQTSLPNLTSYTDVRGIFGVRLSDSLTLPIIHAAGANNASAGAGLAVTGGGLTIIGGGENTPLGILHNAIARSGTTGAAGTALNPCVEEIVLASDNGVSIFTGGTTASPNAYIDNDGTYHGAIELAGAKGLTTSIAGGVTTVRKKWTKNSMGANAGWQKIADGSLTGNSDINILFEVVDTLTHSHGILRLGCRVSTVNDVANTAITDVDHVQGPRLSWVCRDKELNPEHFRLNYVQMTSGSTRTRGLWELQFYHHRKNYATVFTVLTEEGTNGINLPDYTLYEGATASDISSGTTVVSTDVIRIGGTWNSSTHCTENAKGITIGAYGKCTTATEGNISIGGYNSKSTTATGSWAVAIGAGCSATGGTSTALGFDCSTASANGVAIGRGCSTTGTNNGVAIGNACTSSGAYGGVAIGISNTAASYATALGYDNTSSGADSFTGGRSNTASAFASTAFGFNNNVSSNLSFAAGLYNKVSASGGAAIGLEHTNSSCGCTMVGIAGKTKTAHSSTATGVDDGDVFVVGNGTVTESNGTYNYTYRNAFRVSYKGNVYLYSGGAHQSSGADYAEFVKEWFDGNPDNEDRVGYMVTIKNGKLHKANEGDYIIGITSGAPAVIGNVDTEYFWKYKKDDFNRMIYQDTQVTMNGETITSHEPVINESYNPELEDSYIARVDRPEWDYVGMRGIVSCRDDGTCVEGGFCKCGANGIATKADTRGFDTYYVLERINDHVISVEVK